jgi:hypothetical protein
VLCSGRGERTEGVQNHYLHSPTFPTRSAAKEGQLSRFCVKLSRRQSLTFCCFHHSQLSTYFKKAELLGKGDETNKHFQLLFKEEAKLDEMREALNELQEEQGEPGKCQQLLNNFIDSVTLKRAGPSNATPAAQRAAKSNSPSQSRATTPTTQS